MTKEMKEKMVSLLNDDVFDEAEKQNMANAYNMLLEDETLGRKNGVWVLIEGKK